MSVHQFKPYIIAARSTAECITTIHNVMPVQDYHWYQVGMYNEYIFYTVGLTDEDALCLSLKLGAEIKVIKDKNQSWNQLINENFDPDHKPDLKS